MAITRNMVTDYGADSTGSVSCTSDFYSDLKTDGQGQDVILTIPAGTYNFKTFGGVSFTDGMLSLDVTATGASIGSASFQGNFFLQTSHIAQIGIDQTTGTPTGFSTPGGKSARIQTVNAGSNSVTLTSASAASGHISRFTVGDYMMVAGWDIQGTFQGAFGFPPNFQWVEFVQITDITGDTITFTPALRYFYDENWPEMHRGTASEADGGGPATIYAISPYWGTSVTYNDGTYYNNNLINCCARDFTMNGGVSANLPIFPTMNRTWTANGHTTGPALVEVDKCNDTANFIGGTHEQIHCQSASTRLININGGAVVDSLNGTVRNTVVDNATLGFLRVGPTSYGKADTFRCTNSTLNLSAVIPDGLSDTGPRDQGWHNSAVLQMSGGVITIPKCYGDRAMRVLVPDAQGRNVNFWNGGSVTGYGVSGTIGNFKVLSVTSDPWPAVDNQSETTDVTFANASTSLSVSTNIFASGDVGKVIIIPAAGNAAGTTTLKTVITAFTDAQNVTVYDPCVKTTGLSASSQTLQWGTSNMYFQTDQAGGLPDSSLYGNGLSIGVPPARSVYFENCTGTDEVLDLCQAGARNKPLWSYTNRTYTGTNAGDVIKMLGNLVSIKINVIRAYSGVQGTLTAGLNTNNNVKGVQSGSLITFGPRVNLKIIGERVWTIGSTTGLQSGDTLSRNGSNVPGATITAPIWMSGIRFGPALSATISGEDPSVWPEYTVEIITDQGIPAETPTAIVPLRWRLRAA
jgi:hypothetical protein